MAQILSQVVGHANQIEKMKRAALSGRLFPVQILAGPESIGKSLVARGMAQFVLCDTQNGCGQCASCLKVAAGQHESLLWIENQTAQIKIEQAHAILEFQRLKSWNQRRCIVMDDAATLTLPAANTLLKTLEESPDNTWFFLVTSSLYSVLSTIRSRSQVVAFHALERAQLAALLPADAPAWVLGASGGSVLQARDLLDEEAQTLRASAFEILVARLKGATAFCREKIAELNPSQEQALFLLRLWRQMVRDLSVLQSGAVATSLIHEDLVRSVAAPAVAEHLDAAFRYLLRAEQDLLHHVDKNLIFENFVLGRLDDGTV